MRRPLFLIVLLLAVPAAAWAAYSEPEVADPTFFVDPDSIPDQLQVDDAGRAYFVSQADVPVGNPEDAETDRQVVVYERCGTDWQVDSEHGLDDDSSFTTRPISLEVAANGDMLVVWLDGSTAERTIQTSFRPAGGDWAPRQAIEAPNVTHVLSDIAPTGDAVIAYQEDAVDAPLQVAVRTKASGVWAPEELGEIDGLWAVAMSPAADAIVLTADRGALATTLNSWHRPAGGDWGTKEEVDDALQTTLPLRTAIAFAPDGKAVLGVGVPSLFGVTEPEVQTAVRGAGSSGTWSDLEPLSAVDSSVGFILGIDAATHPGGVVLGWIEQQNGAAASDLVVARYDGTSFEAPKMYDLENQFIALSVGAAPSGKAILAAQHETTDDRNRIVIAEAPSIDAPWGDVDEIPAPAGDHRDPLVGAGGIVAIGYGVHGSDQRSEVVADGPSPACVSATPTPSATATATATATASPNPQPQPPPPAPDVAAPTGKLQKVVFKGGKVRITMRLDEAATVTFKVDGKALAKRNLKAGTRKLALKPRKKLKRGRHTLTAKARDAAGNSAKTLKKRFKVG